MINLKRDKCFKEDDLYDYLYWFVENKEEMLWGRNKECFSLYLGLCWWVCGKLGYLWVNFV